MNTLFPFFLVLSPLIGFVHARSNVTLQLGLSYDGNPECEDSPYVVSVCVGEKKQKCSIYPWTTFYLQADCATNELPKVIEFVTEKLDKTLILEANIRPIGESAYELRPVEALLTKSREISMASDELMFVLRFRVSFSCQANYFGHLCDVYCSSDAKEYECTSSGEKICKPEYVKVNSTGECIHDKCKKMTGYCLNNGVCINRAETAENTVPICSCSDEFEGFRCETVRKPIDRKSSGRNISVNVIDKDGSNENDGKKEVIAGAAQNHEKARNILPLSDETYKPANDRYFKDPRVPVASASSFSNSDSNQLKTDKALWYQVLVFTSATVCITLLVCSVCLGTACYVYRLKKKTKLYRNDQVSSVGELRYIDNDSIPAYARRVSSLGLNFTQSMHRDPSIRSCSAMNRPYSSVSPTQIPDLEAQLVYANNQNQCNWPPLRLNGSDMQHYWDYRSETPMYDSRADPDQSMDSGQMFNQSISARNPDIYSCRTMYKYTHPDLTENISFCPYEANVNSLTLTMDRSRQLLSGNTMDRTSFIPTKFLIDNGELEKSTTRSNGYQNLVAEERKDSVASFEPPTAFADVNCSV